MRGAAAAETVQKQKASPLVGGALIIMKRKYRVFVK